LTVKISLSSPKRRHELFPIVIIPNVIIPKNFSGFSGFFGIFHLLGEGERDKPR